MRSNSVGGTSVVVVLLSCIVLVLVRTMQPGLTMPQSAMERASSVHIAENVDFGRHFRDLGLEGSILIYDLKSDRAFEYNRERNQRAFPVASTFKMLNSLIALETGVIADEILIFAGMKMGLLA